MNLLVITVQISYIYSIESEAPFLSCEKLESGVLLQAMEMES